MQLPVNYGTPHRAEENRALVRQRLSEAHNTGGLQETLTIEWRGKARHVEVIDMPVENLVYNPSTHRIRAQRSFDPAQEQELNNNPWSEESQGYLAFLLRALPSDPSKPDPDFETLKESLREFKQNEPGLITQDGVLVNGNTRCVALKDLGVQHIRVGVLPESCTWEDISAVELSLQLRREHKREYSYINRLLSIDEQVSMGRAVPDIAREFRMKPKSVERDIWILTTLRDLIARSREGDRQLRLMDFEDQQEKLSELHRRYQLESAASKERADLLKENRLAAITLGYSKTDVRHIEVDFRTRYLDRHLSEELRTSAPDTPTSTAIPGLNRKVRAASAQVTQARAFTDILLKARTEEKSNNQASPVLQHAREALDSALKAAGKDSLIRKKQRAVSDRIDEARAEIEQSITDLVLARASSSLDEEAYDDALASLRDALAKLAVESARTIKVPGDGVAWLLEATGVEGK
ncbi:transcriptional regulator [Nonomuraea sp. B1E8]|uniref:transcriptional regulator n=1 Tax=unclassified Nonomuraea TaxID=2593643 RepID=UPI00325D62DD